MAVYEEDQSILDILVEMADGEGIINCSRIASLLPRYKITSLYDKRGKP